MGYSPYRSSFRQRGTEGYKLFVIILAVVIIGAIWAAVSSDCNLEGGNNGTSVRSGSRGHSRSYSHGGKY